MRDIHYVFSCSYFWSNATRKILLLSSLSLLLSLSLFSQPSASPFGTAMNWVLPSHIPHLFWNYTLHVLPVKKKEREKNQREKICFPSFLFCSNEQKKEEKFQKFEHFIHTDPHIRPVPFTFFPSSFSSQTKKLSESQLNEKILVPFLTFHPFAPFLFHFLFFT